MSEPSTRRLIEVGLVLPPADEPDDMRLVEDVAGAFRAALDERFPGVDWRVPIRRVVASDHVRMESIVLLRQAAVERERGHWDFSLLVTADELIAHFRPSAFAVLSRPLDAAVISLRRLRTNGARSSDPAPASDTPDPRRARLLTLMLHAIGHLAGLASHQDPANLMHRPAHATGLDTMHALDDAQRAQLAANFGAIADPRLEEQSRNAASRGLFYLRAMWINRRDIANSVLAARPWQMPLRLVRLTTAALSTIAILMMTAESWDLGLAQRGATLSSLAAVVLLVTATLVLMQQRLLPAHRQLREQLVAAQVSATLIVVFGLATSWALGWLLACLAAATLFPAELIHSWAGSTEAGTQAITFVTFAKMSTFAASIGLLIGSLGASFEDQHHFQHVILVDEEI